jgi:hypothetical protein
MLFREWKLSRSRKEGLHVVKRRQDIIAGIILLFVSIAIFISSGYIPRMVVTTLGPDFMPKLIATGMAGLSCLLIVFGYKRGSSAKSAVRQDGTFIKRHIDLITIGFLVFYALCISFLGFLIATSIYLFLQISLMGIMRKLKPIITAIVSIASSAIIYFIFTRYLSVMLPAGILG